jgi:AcrR family transcriptional regulator
MEKYDFSELELSDKEERILHSAIKIFSEKGYDGARTSEIAKDAGVAEGTIFKYYKTKKGILTKILIQLINIMSEKVVLSSIKKIFQDSSKKDPKQIIKEIFYDRIKLVDNIFPMAKIVLIEAMLHEEVREAIYKNIISKALDFFKEFHKKAGVGELIRDDIDPFYIFRSILANIAVLIMQKQVFSKRLPVKDLDKEMDIIIDIILNGIGKK